jgi:hypothetical protein
MIPTVYRTYYKPKGIKAQFAYNIFKLFCSVLVYSAVNILNLKRAGAEHVKTSTSSTHHSAKS